MSKARLRARRSRYRLTTLSLSPRAPALAAGALLLIAAVVLAVVAGRVVQFINSVSHGVGDVRSTLDPPAGSVAWKLKHGQAVNILLLGYGGPENDSPLLTDSMMIASLDPSSHRVVLTSVPRDLWVTYDAWDPSERALKGHAEKINQAFQIGNEDSWGRKLPAYTGRDGGGRLAEHEVGTVTGVHFDKYVAVDFKAFRDAVNALGGVQVCLDTPLDDNEYPDYHNGYIKGGIHFKQGCYQVNGEQALQLARSRHASQPEQANDFGRARRQQMVLTSIRKKATSPSAVSHLFSLLGSLEHDVRTDMDVNDFRAVTAWGGGLKDSDFVRLALTNEDFLNDQDQPGGGRCGPRYSLCPEDPSYALIHSYLAHSLLDPKALSEKASVQIANGTFASPDVSPRVSKALGTLGLQAADGGRWRAREKTVVYDYSAGKYPNTAQWLSAFFGVEVTPAPSPNPAPGETPTGLVVVVGRDFGLRWYGRG